MKRDVRHLVTLKEMWREYQKEIPEYKVGSRKTEHLIARTALYEAMRKYRSPMNERLSFATIGSIIDVDHATVLTALKVLKSGAWGWEPKHIELLARYRELATKYVSEAELTEFKRMTKDVTFPGVRLKKMSLKLKSIADKIKSTGDYVDYMKNYIDEMQDVTVRKLEKTNEALSAVESKLREINGGLGALGYSKLNANLITSAKKESEIKRFKPLKNYSDAIPLSTVFEAVLAVHMMLEEEIKKNSVVREPEEDKREGKFNYKNVI